MTRQAENIDSVKAGIYLWFVATILLTAFSLINMIKARKGVRNFLTSSSNWSLFFKEEAAWVKRWDMVITDTHQILTLAILVMLPISYYIPAVIGTYFLWCVCIILLLKPEIFPEAFRNYAVVGAIGGLSLFLWISLWATDYTS